MAGRLAGFDFFRRLPGIPTLRETPPPLILPGTAIGNHIIYRINGQITTEMIDDSPKACQDGVIGLQMHADHTLTLQFKDLKIMMLDR